MQHKNDKPDAQKPKKKPRGRGEHTREQLLAIAKKDPEARKVLADILRPEPEERESTREKLGKALVNSGRNRARATVWKPIVLKALAEIPNWTFAAQCAGIADQTILDYRERHPDFALKCEQAMQIGVRKLELHCWKRATIGWQRPVFQGGVQVGSETLYDSRLAEILLRAHGGSKYWPKTQTDVTTNGQPIQPIVTPAQVVISIPDNGRDVKAITDIPSEVKPAEPEPGEQTGGS